MPWSAGAVLTAAQLNTYLPQAWSTYTPAVVNMPLTSVSGAYIAYGKTVHVKVYALASGAVSGTITVSLPLTASSRFGVSGSAGLLEGNAVGVDSGTTVTPGYIQLGSDTTVRVLSSIAGSSVAWNATTPHTWANTDVLVLAFTYEAA